MFRLVGGKLAKILLAKSILLLFYVIRNTKTGETKLLTGFWFQSHKAGISTRGTSFNQLENCHQKKLGHAPAFLV